MTYSSAESSGILVGVLVVLMSSFLYFLYKGYYARRQFYLLRQQGMPMPPWSPIFGHLLAIAPILKTLPKKAQQAYYFNELVKDFDDSDTLFYLDLWPFSTPLCLVSSPSLAIQAASQQYDLIKPPTIDYFFRPLAGGDNLFTMNGAEWKRSHALFVPGFQISYLLSQMSHIVEETLVYVSVLEEHAAKGDMFSLDDVTLWFTMDIIAAVTLNCRTNSQRNYNSLTSALRSQVSWLCLEDELNPLVRWNPLRPLTFWWNGHKMDRYISKELDKRFAERRRSETDVSESSRSIIDLALEGYIAENPSVDLSKGLDDSFKKWACVQIRLFLFAGHDSTASTICYIYYLIFTHPGALSRIRAEHDKVFGTDLSRLSTLLIDQPHLINQLPYTIAVIKEAMRLFPPASGLRGGRSDVHLNAEGKLYPTDGTSVWIVHAVLHRHPKYWKNPDSFIPERWLVGPEDPLYPPKGAWRPFEFGPRNCIGQSLVMLDVSVTLAMTLRRFEIHNAYAEWDSLYPKAPQEIRTVRDERAYQVSLGGAHPADGFPCHVLLRKGSEQVLECI